MADHKQSIIDAIKASDAPNDVKVIGYALTHLFTGMCSDLKRIAEALECQPDPVCVTEEIPVDHVLSRAGLTGKRAPTHQGGGVAVTEKTWRTWDGSSVRPLHLPDATTVRVQFRSKPDHVETYRLDSSEIDWTDVIAYQIIKPTE